MRTLRAQLASGFSLIEVLVVLAIAAILATLSVSYLIGSRPAALLHQAEMQLSTDLGLARDAAYNEETPTRVVFDLGTGEYWSEQQDPSTSAWTGLTEHKTLPDTISFTAINFPGDTVSFTPRGTLVVGGSITFANSSGGNATLSGVIPTGRFPLLGGALR
jgi:prepilin-type N-terminal cleavage/methylation domain-containing protein